MTVSAFTKSLAFYVMALFIQAKYMSGFKTIF